MAQSLGSNSMILSTQKTVTTAGTAESLLASSPTGGSFWPCFTIVAKSTNTGQVYIGGSDVDNATNDGLDAGQSIEFSCTQGKNSYDLSKIYIDVDTSGDGVDIYASK